MLDLAHKTSALCDFCSYQFRIRTWKKEVLKLKFWVSRLFIVIRGFGNLGFIRAGRANTETGSL